MQNMGAEDRESRRTLVPRRVHGEPDALSSTQCFCRGHSRNDSLVLFHSLILIVCDNLSEQLVPKPSVPMMKKSYQKVV